MKTEIGKSVVSAADGQRPVVFGDTAPEGPDPDDREKGEQCLEQSSVDFTACGLAEMNTDHVLEDLANGE